MDCGQHPQTSPFANWTTKCIQWIHASRVRVGQRVSRAGANHTHIHTTRIYMHARHMISIVVILTDKVCRLVIFSRASTSPVNLFSQISLQHVEYAWQTSNQDNCISSCKIFKKRQQSAPTSIKVCNPINECAFNQFDWHNSRCTHKKQQKQQQQQQQQQQTTYEHKPRSHAQSFQLGQRAKNLNAASQLIADKDSECEVRTSQQKRAQPLQVLSTLQTRMRQIHLINRDPERNVKAFNNRQKLTGTLASSGFEEPLAADP